MGDRGRMLPDGSESSSQRPAVWCQPIEQNTIEVNLNDDRRLGGGTLVRSSVCWKTLDARFGGAKRDNLLIEHRFVIRGCGSCQAARFVGGSDATSPSRRERGRSERGRLWCQFGNAARTPSHNSMRRWIETLAAAMAERMASGVWHTEFTMRRVSGP